MQGFPELSRSYVTDKRQEFLLEDTLEDFDNGLLCGTCMHHDRHGDHSLLLRDLGTRSVDIPVPLRHIPPQFAAKQTTCAQQGTVFQQQDLASCATLAVLFPT